MAKAAVETKIEDLQLLELAKSLKRYRGVQRIAIAIALIETHYNAFDPKPFRKLFRDLRGYVNAQNETNRAKLISASGWASGRAIQGAHIAHPLSLVFGSIVALASLLDEDKHSIVEQIIKNIDNTNKMVRDKQFGRRGRGFKVVGADELKKVLERVTLVV